MSGFHAAAAPKCFSCDRTVYKMEEVNAIGHFWHKDCFICGGNSNHGGCKKHLTLDNYTDHEGQPFCKTCHGRLFGPRGYLAGQTAVHTFAEDGVHAATDGVAAATISAETHHETEAGHVAHHVAAAGAGHAVAVGGGAPKCFSCDHTVYKMEEVNAIGHFWHKDCFICGGSSSHGGCKKHLTLDSYTDHEGQPFCKSCHSRLFGPRGYLAGQTAVHTFVEDGGVAAAVAAAGTAQPAATATETHHETEAGHVAHHVAAAAGHGVAVGGGAPKCFSCDRTVYKMEEVNAIGHFWHKDCFLCGGSSSHGGCKKHLTLDTYTDHEGQPFCKPCHARLFGPRGYLAGQTAVHTYVEDGAGAH